MVPRQSKTPRGKRGVSSLVVELLYVLDCSLRRVRAPLQLLFDPPGVRFVLVRGCTAPTPLAPLSLRR